MVGSGAGSLLGGLFGGKDDDDTPKPPTVPGAQTSLAALAAQLQSQAGAYTNPFETVGYKAQVGSIRDALRSQSQTDAGRAGALGLDPGLSFAAGAQGRATGLAAALRGAASSAESQAAAQRSQSQGLLASVLGNLGSIEQANLNRQTQERGNTLGLLGALGGAAVQHGLPLLFREKEEPDVPRGVFPSNWW
jgi:hypothetical protein